MVYSYLLNLYGLLKRRKTEISNRHPQGPDYKQALLHQQGQLDTIAEFESYLRVNFHSKLPRRMQKESK